MTIQMVIRWSLRIRGNAEGFAFMDIYVLGCFVGGWIMIEFVWRINFYG